MRMFLSAAAALAVLCLATPARAVDPPYLALARAVGTPKLAASYGPPDKSRLLLKFVPEGESLERWTKLTTVSILKVAPADTDSATRSVIAQLQTQLAKRRAQVRTFDRSLTAPLHAYFEFTADGETEKGIVYSPDPGYVTAAQIGAKGHGTVTPGDAKKLRSIIGR